MRLSQYSNIKFTHERASHPSQEIAINTKLQIKKRQEIAAEKQADKERYRKDLENGRSSNSIYQFEDILSEISTRIDRIGFVKLMEQQSIARRDLPIKLRYYTKALHFCTIHP